MTSDKCLMAPTWRRCWGCSRTLTPQTNHGWHETNDEQALDILGLGVWCVIGNDVPSGKHTKNYGKIHHLKKLGKSTNFRLGHGFQFANCKRLPVYLTINHARDLQTPRATVQLMGRAESWSLGRRAKPSWSMSISPLEPGAIGKKSHRDLPLVGNILLIMVNK